MLPLKTLSPFCDLDSCTNRIINNFCVTTRSILYTQDCFFFYQKPNVYLPVIESGNVVCVAGLLPFSLGGLACHDSKAEYYAVTFVFWIINQFNLLNFNKTRKKNTTTSTTTEEFHHVSSRFRKETMNLFIYHIFCLTTSNYMQNLHFLLCNMQKKLIQIHVYLYQYYPTKITHEDKQL